MWERESDLWKRCDWMDSSYYSPSNKQELLEKQARDKELRDKFPNDFKQHSSSQEIKHDNQ